MKRFSAKRAVKSVLRKLIYPRQFLQFLRLARASKRAARVTDDAQLRFYSQILPGDFLHYGYFDDPDVAPEALSLHDVQRAQLRYGELLLEQIANKEAPVLDVGCGMGGLLNLMLNKGFSAVALTPDRTQARYVKEKYPSIRLIEGKFEQMSGESDRHSFGTVITSESLQYLNLDKALPLLEQILTPKGRWIASDYFRVGQSSERESGHRWEQFLQKLKETGWKVVYEQDITKNVMPTLAYVEMWGKKAGFPLYTFSVEKLQQKHPGIYFLLEEGINDLTAYLSAHLDLVSPEIFAREKKYMLVVMERS